VAAKNVSYRIKMTASEVDFDKQFCPLCAQSDLIIFVVLSDTAVVQEIENTKGTEHFRGREINGELTAI